MSRFFRRGAWSIALVLAVVALQSSPSANHSWNGYHWARTANPFLILAGNNLSPEWQPIFSTSLTDWSKSTVLDMTAVAGGAKSRNCRPTSGQIEVCDSTYGNTGWLGVAQIWISGTHIAQGTVKLNDTYFHTAQYNTTAWRNLVSCQEIGHTLGLDHQDENFNNPNLNTCMDYTNDPSSNQHPNSHDYDELVTIYSHLDSSSSVSSPAATGANVDNPSEWGQLMKTSRGGRLQVFERDFGNNQHIVTFVIWA